MLGFGCKITTPDENFSLSQALWQGDETKISSGVSQSHRGDESFEIVQYARPVSRSSNNSIASNEQYFPSWFADVDSLVTLRTRNYFLRVFRVTTSVSLADSARGRFSLPNRT